MKVVAILPLVAAAAAIPQLVPQLRRLRHLQTADGVSPTWAVLTAVNNLAWLTYFTSTELLTGMVPAISVALLAIGIVVTLARIGTPIGRSVGLGAAWTAVLTSSVVVGGAAALGGVLAGAFVLQVAPALRTAVSATGTTGVSRLTWVLLSVEVACWGTVGLIDARLPLIFLGAFGLTASVAMLWLTRPGRHTARSDVAAPSPVLTGATT